MDRVCACVCVYIHIYKYTYTYTNTWSESTRHFILHWKNWDRESLRHLTEDLTTDFTAKTSSNNSADILGVELLVPGLWNQWVYTVTMKDLADFYYFIYPGISSMVIKNTENLLRGMARVLPKFSSVLAAVQH